MVKLRNRKWRKVGLLIPLLLFMCILSYSQEPLPKGAKLEKINYSQMDKYQRCLSQCYQIEGYVSKGVFVDNQKISIFDVNGKNIISGTYYAKDDGHSYIDGTCYVDNNYYQRWKINKPDYSGFIYLFFEGDKLSSITNL